MRNVITENTVECACGKTVARLMSLRTGKEYSVEAPDGVRPGMPAEVGVANFHNCTAKRVESEPIFATLVGFVRKAASNGAKKMVLTFENAGAVVAISFKSDRGILYVTDGKPYGENRYFGAIDTASAKMRTGRDKMSAPESLLFSAIAADPAKAAAESGHLTGRCSFCSRTLDDSRSVQHGYGPQCAKKFGLPWNAARKVA
jgi:hypothetical protein